MKRKILTNLKLNVPKVKCAICKTSVHRLTSLYDVYTRSTVFTVYCHGDKEKVSIRDDQVINGGMIFSGTAFQSNIETPKILINSKK